MGWECQRCGACCEILPLVLFDRPCVNYDSKKRLCKIYENRPEICHVRHPLGGDITLMLCEQLREIQRRNI